MYNGLKRLPLYIAFPLFDTANQLCMKFLGLATGDLPFGTAWLERVGLSPYFWGAMLADVGSFVAWMLILKKSNLSFATPFISVQYITILIGSYVLFHEPINLAHVVGVGCIVAGLLLIGMDEVKKDA